MVVGESGIGKTSLIENLIHTLSISDFHKFR